MALSGYSQTNRCRRRRGLLITEAPIGSLSDDLGPSDSALRDANLPGRGKSEKTFSFRLKGTSLTDLLTFNFDTSGPLEEKL